MNSITCEAVAILRLVADRLLDYNKNMKKETIVATMFIASVSVGLGLIASSSSSVSAPSAEPGQHSSPPFILNDSQTNASQAGSQVVTAARKWLAENMNVSVQSVVASEVVEQTWQDSCLGMAGEGDICTPGPIKGYKILFRVEGQKYPIEVHTDSQGAYIGTLGAVIR